MLIPSTAATIETRHSLKFVKNDLHSTMSEDCMNALMLLYIHKDLSLNYDQIIDDLARRNPRKILLVHPLGSMKKLDLPSQCFIFIKNLCKG